MDKLTRNVRWQMVFENNPVDQLATNSVAYRAAHWQFSTSGDF